MSDNMSVREFRGDDTNLTVALRIRPMTEDEILRGATPIAHRVDENLVVLMDPMDDIDDSLRHNRSREKQYVFDMVLDAKSAQEDVYEKTVRFLIPSVINGFNSTVFAYGPTGAGKTYTMLGRDHDEGIMVRALTELFYLMSQSEDDLVFRVSMSYLEIYNEMIRDLLNPSSGYLDLREDSKGVQVAGLSEHSATSTEEVMRILMEGNIQRTQEPTAANQTSSRSHAVLQISVRQRSRTAGIHQQLRVGRLFLIDLAGSERAANTQNRGKRMVEGAHINRSLLALGNCINALSERSGSKYINYRDSKLTRLLKDALGGNCKTVMIAHISPASFFFEESRNTLSYADRAKNIKTKVRANVLDMTLHISQYSNIIADLRDEIRRLKLRLEQQQQQRTAHAIQAEVMQSSRYAEDQAVDLSRLKQELMNVYQRQVELRRHLVELNNSEAESSLESTRIQLEIKQWERDNLLADRQIKDGIVSPRPHDPAALAHAQERLAALALAKDQSDRRKAALEREIDNIKNKSLQVEEELGRFSNTVEQQEIVRLLARVHTVETENTRLQSDLLQRSLELKRRELFIVLQDHHLAMGDELIQKQKARGGGGPGPGGSDPRVPTPDLYDVFEQEGQDLRIQKMILLPGVDKKADSLQIVSRPSDDVRLPRLFLNDNFGATGEPSMRLFLSPPLGLGPSPLPSPHPREPEGAGRGGGGGRDLEDLILESEDRRQIANSTRSIAVLAAQRRGGYKGTNEQYNEQLRHSRLRAEGSDLTQSRLAQHDRRYPLSLAHPPPSDLDRLSLTPNERRGGRGAQARGAQQKGGMRVTPAFTVVESVLSEGEEEGGYDLHGKQNVRYVMESVPEVGRKAPTNQNQGGGAYQVSNQLQWGKVPLRPVHRSKSLHRQKQNKHASDFTDTYSLADTRGGNNKKSGPVPPAAANTSYRHDDFSVTGFALQ